MSIVWEKEYEDMFKKIRYSIYEHDRNEYYILIEQCLKYKNDWNVEFKSQLFSSRVQCMKYLYRNEIGLDIFPSWLKKIIQYLKIGLISIFSLMLFFIVGKFVVGGIKEFGLEDNSIVLLYVAVPLTVVLWLWLGKKIGVFFRKFKNDQDSN